MCADETKEIDIILQEDYTLSRTQAVKREKGAGRKMLRNVMEKENGTLYLQQDMKRSHCDMLHYI